MMNRPQPAANDAYFIEREGLTLRFVPKRADEHSEPPQFHSLYYDCAGNRASSRTPKTETLASHPLEGTSHGFMRQFHDAYKIVQSFAPSLLPELAPAFVWDSRCNLHATTQLPYTLPPESALDLGTYFNSFYVSVIESIIGKRPFHLFVEFQGTLTLEVSAHTVHGQRESIYNGTINRSSRGWVVLPLTPVVASLQPHRLSVRLTTERGAASLHALHFATPAAADKHTCRFAILIRTFNRVQECKRLLSTIASHPSFRNVNVHVILHDAGSAFTPSELQRICGNIKVTLIHQDNYGSSGNLVILLDELRKSYSCAELDETVAAILDDDILVHPESLLRAYSLVANALSEKAMIVGSFLDRCRPMNIDATVALYGDDVKRDAAMHLQPLRGGDRVDNPYYLDLSCQPVSGNTAAFYLLVARATLLTSTNPLPLFLKWDDIDYTATLHKKGAQLTAIPGVSVWHDAFYDCMPVWQEVLNLKHGLIVDMVHLDHPWPVVYASIRDILFRHLLVYDYNTCEAMLSSVTDALTGCSMQTPSALLEASRAQIAILAQQYKSLQDAARRLAPDSRTLTRCLMTKEPCKLADGTFAIVVHELFPEPPLGNYKVFVKHASAASRSMVLNYECERHNAIATNILLLSKMEARFHEARESWRSCASDLRTESSWNPILTTSQQF